MRRTLEAKRARAGLLLALLLTAGCADELPTVSGEDRFPPGLTPVTVDLIVPTEALLLSDTTFDGFSDPKNAPFLLVAEEFGGALDAHALVGFSEFPDSVTFTVDGAARTDTVFAYVSGQVVTAVDSSASAGGPVRLRLWALGQAWDTATVSWQFAVDRPGQQVAWAVPGGTPAELLAEAVWTPGDTVPGDSVVWQLDSLAVRRLAQEGHPGVMVTSADPGSRVQLSSFLLRAKIRPESKADTVLDRTIGTTAQRFVFTPPPPQAPGVYRVGGITGARTILRLDLDQTVPACVDMSDECPRVPLRDVTLNQAALLLDPIPVPAGFRPLTVSTLLARRVVEPELGRLAPLGETLAADTVTPGAFVGVGNDPVRLILTSAVRRAVASDSTTISLALLGERGAAQFGYQWYAPQPRLRLVYTLPLRPRLP